MKIDALKKVDDLGTAVNAASCLVGQGLVAMLAGSPSRLWVLPGAGSPSISEVPVQSAQDVALLSKRTAVVLGSDGTAWAILDLGGSARAKAVARDVRALAMRPWGESALALGADGHATALTLSREDVAARAFSMRGGVVRACDVGEHVTHVVIDSAEGGQLRIHPGATPELGTSAKTALPAASAGLDRVRGGASLSVLYKRGSELICAVTGTPNKLSAKMIKLDAKVLDAGVAEGCLIAALQDGRVATYDLAAIEGAGDDPVAPSSAAQLGTKGRAKVLLATIKGVWIGTTTGEVMSVAMARGEAQPPAADPVRTRLASLDEELHKAKDALNDALHEREEATRRSKEVAAEQERVIHEAHAVEVATLKGQIDATNEAHAADIKTRDETIAKLREDLDAANDAHATALKASEEAHAAAICAHDETLSLRAEFDAANEAHANALKASEEAHANALKERDETLAKLRADLDAANEASAKASAALAEAEEAKAKLRAELAEERERLENAAAWWAELDRARERVGSVLSQLQGIFNRKRE